MATRHQKPDREFGTRRPVVPVTTQPGTPSKRSGQVGLLMMGTLMVGTAAYTFMPRGNCEPAQNPSVAQPSLLQSNADCSSRGSSSGGGHGGSGRSSLYSNGSSSSGPSASGGSDSGSSHVARGGFGSFGHAFGFSGG
jgi:hypothetical protein